MDVEAIEGALLDWLGEATGLSHVQLEEADRDFEANPCALVKIGEVADLGLPETEWTDDGDQIKPRILTNRRMVVSLSVDGLEQSGNNSPRYYIERARSFSRVPRSHEILSQVGLAIASSLSTIDATYDSDGRRRARCIWDVVFDLAITWTPEDGTNASVDWFDTAKVTSDGLSPEIDTEIPE